MSNKTHQAGVASLFELCMLCLLLAFTFIFFTIERSNLNKQEPETSSEETHVKPLLGYSISPFDFSADGIEDYFNKARSLKGAVTWAGDWGELGAQAGGPNILINNYNKYEYTPIIKVTTHKDIGNSKLTPIRELNAINTDEYISNIRQYAQKHKPKYIGVGIEVNRIYESSPDEYSLFLNLFNNTTDAIHQVSPKTLVFTSFQLERLRGLKGGLYGGQNNESSNDLMLLADFSKADLLAFTTYPSLIYQNPNDIPANYYTDLFELTDKPIAISEMGWPSGSVANGWESTPEEQKAFLEYFKPNSKLSDYEFIIWSFLYDQNVAFPFNTMGLVNPENGVEKPAYSVFNSLK